MTDTRTPDTRAAGTFKIGGEREVVRLGYGAMRIAGPGVWGPPRDREAALATLRRLPALGVNFIDTADSYGPDISEPLIREALHPYDGLFVATKAGLKRPGPDQWAPHGDPDYLIAQAHRSRELLGVETIDLWQLHRIDPKVPAGEQFDAIARLLAEGVIRHAGLSQVTVAEIAAARAVFPVATVQNRYNLGDRSSEDVLDYCAREGIGFIPWYPLSAGKLTEKGSVLDRIAQDHGATPGQIALAWLLQRSPVMLPIPGTGQVHHLEENVAAAAIRLSEEAFAELDEAGRG
ncbi:aldo/keto reductase [Sphingomonas azotifigens]|uniref:aldo/keto reductase n=1 Tax=Sphingomonas azotifigens TaxID=330920 RepID=UPI000A032573|nr:aldo/keto reductase [Sphingomonas azotifigens]